MSTRQLLGWTVLMAAAVALFAAAVLVAFRQTSFALGILCGYFLGSASLVGLGWWIGGTIKAGNRTLRICTLIILNFGKYAIIGIIIWAILRAGINGVGIAIGLSIVYLSLTISGFLQARRLRKIEEG